MTTDDGFTRRTFVKGAAVVTATMLTNSKFAAAATDANAPTQGADTTGSVPHRPLGKTGAMVSALGVGGYHLGSTKNQEEANEIVATAMGAGINFFDNAWEYHDSVSEEKLGIALKGKRQNAFVMTKVCTHGRKKDVAMKMLEESLRRLQTDHLDLWQIHEVVYYNDPEMIFAPDGVAEALIAAKQQGKVRFVGFTGHKNPKIHLRMLAENFPFDTVQMPLNCLDATFRSFETQVLPVANQKGVGVLGMKSLGGSGEIVTHGAATAQEALSYALSLPASTIISGMDSLEVLQQNLKIAINFKPLDAAALQATRDHVRQFAADGRYELFKTTTKYDGAVGRQQHHFPTTDKLPA
jgi:aryl-alcohol dehydrogenase-like predicted oxidoreductase